MRALIAATLAASLFSTSLMAAEVNAPLAPGHAAGVKQAQALDETTWLLIAGAAIIAVVVVAASGSGFQAPAPAATANASTPTV